MDVTVNVGSIYLLTVEEFDRIPNPPGGHYELRHGEAVFASYPDKIHKAIQRWLRRFLETAATSAGVKGVVDTEFPFRPYAEHELWSADVAFVSQPRYDAFDRWLTGSPELVIEVKSPSNSDRELHDKAVTCLGGGCEEFWIVDSEKRLVTVYTPSGIRRYDDRQAVPAPLFATQLFVSELFDSL